MSVWQSLDPQNRYYAFPPEFYSLVTPTPLENSRWVIWNGELAQSLGFPADPTEELRQAFSGERIPACFKPLAMKYAGHQFGIYNPDLGDGRGLLLADVTSGTGQVFDLHLKGAGLTPYSRMGDGRAVLRSTIREYLCSEAMAGLGIPTTRALTMLASDSPVYRERVETGALLVRVAESHIRFGHFEHFFYTNQIEQLTLLADKVIEWHFPECTHQDNPYRALFGKVTQRTAEMIAHWQSVGFAHGVMNTDNMSILGQTFDYGPYAFLDEYNPSLVCNHSDYQGRYAFNNQPNIALWNLTALAHAFSPLIERDDLQQILSDYEPMLSRKYSQLMRKKLGLTTSQEGDSELFADLFTLLEHGSVDYTLFFRQLSYLDTVPNVSVIDYSSHQTDLGNWLERYRLRCDQEVDEAGSPITAERRCASMRGVNPKYVLRNYLAQQAIEQAENGDYSEVHRLAKLLADPYAEQVQYNEYSGSPPEWGKGIEISCSS
jgi:serine/tyrosine/threonine adenylyltransferase